MICYHGTTAKGLRAILSGENHKPNSPWTCSDQDGAMYVWPEGKVVYSEGLEDHDDDEIAEWCIGKAFESAQIQAVTSDETKIYCLVLDIPDEQLEDDFSCENMSDIASYICMDDFDKSMITSIKEFELNKWLAPFVIAGLMANDYFNKWSIDENLLNAAEIISNTDFYLEPTEFDYSDYEV